VGSVNSKIRGVRGRDYLWLVKNVFRHLAGSVMIVYRCSGATVGPEDVMNFISVEYALLFLVVFCLYYAFPRYQLAILLIASLFFYGWAEPLALPILLATAAVSSAITYAILRSPISDNRQRMALGIIVNLLVLAFFKYKFLLLEPLPPDVDADTISGLDVVLYAPLPIGISFYTFHCISLIGDAHRKQFTKSDLGDRADPRRFFGHVLLYLIFFPQIVAGPIVKAHQFMPQINTKSLTDVPFAEAARRIIWGLFFKCFVADNLAQFTVWMNNPGTFQQLGRCDLLLLLFSFSAQIFADFAGYSAIALGSAALLGYRLPINFNRPYVARSFSDFWRRWHMSLSSFLREYLYIPLGGNRKGPVRTYINLFLTMALGGLWHGAALSFLLWGAAHGAALCIERALGFTAAYIPQGKALQTVLTRLYSAIVFLVVSVLWLFFKLQHFDDAILYLETMRNASARFVFDRYQYAIVTVYLLPVALTHFMPKFLADRNGKLSAITYGAMLMLAIFDKGPTDAFIYFQF
jgi:D-alanyl-lipoteichoic acid acyltransferase DltB (MBOAT superfamily)